MNKELFDLIYNYSINNKLADKKFIEYIFNYLLYYYDLSSYVNSLKIVTKKIGLTMGIHSPDDKSITILAENIRLHSEKNKKICNLDSMEYCFLYNAQVVATFLHEFQHALQDKIIDEINFKDILLKTDYELFLIYVSEIFKNENIYNFIYEENIFPKHITNRLYKKVYKYLPTERLAEYYSLTKINNILVNNRIDLTIISSIFDIYKNLKILKGYDKNRKEEIICPSESFLKIIGKKDIWSSFEFYDSNRDTLLDNCDNLFDLDTRLKYGFPISQEEFNNCKDNMMDTYKRLIKEK